MTLLSKISGKATGFSASVTGAKVSLLEGGTLHVHMTGKTFAVLILCSEIVRFVSPYGWADGSAKIFAVGLCLLRLLVPSRRSGDRS